MRLFTNLARGITRDQPSILNTLRRALQQANILELQIVSAQAR